MKINMESVSRQKQGGGAKSSNYRFYSRLIATIAAFSFVSLRAGAATYDGDWTVDGQTQLSEDTTVNGRLVFDGGAVDLNGHNLTLNGGWIVPGTDEIIVNGSFENVSSFTANSGAWAYWKDNGKADGWTTTDTGLVGISKDGQHWINVGVPDGTYVCYLQAQSAAGSSVKQTISLPKTGYYDLSLFYGVRHDQKYGCGLISIWIDDVKAFEAAVPYENFSHFGRAIVRLEAGDHEFVVKNNWNPDYLDKTDQGVWIDKLSLKPLTDLVFNGSFEQESGTWDKYEYWKDGYRAIGWTRTNNVIAGKSVNPWMHNIAVPDGSRTCVLQGQTGDARVAKVSQTIVVPEAGTYLLSFYYAMRSDQSNSAGCGGTLSVSIGGDVKFSKTVAYTTKSYDTSTLTQRTGHFAIVEVTLEAGEQTIEIANDGGGNDATMWVDAVSLVKGSRGANLVANPSFESVSTFTANSGAWAYWKDNGKADGWTTTDTGLVGISKNGQHWINVGVPDGTYVCYLQAQSEDGASVKQSISVPEAGFYEISLDYGVRHDMNHGCGLLTVWVGDDKVFEAAVPNENVPHFGKAVVWLEVGDKELVVKNDWNSAYYPAKTDQNIWVDNVCLCKVSGSVEPEIGNTATGDAASLTMVSSGAVALPPLSGNLKLVVSGGGTFTASVADQSYTGGTEVSGDGTVLAVGTAANPLGSGSGAQTVTVGEGATVDLGTYANGNTCVYNFNLAGSLVCGYESGRNTRRFAALNILSDSASLSMNRGLIGGVGTTDACQLRLNGHVLSISVQGEPLMRYITALDYGTVKFTDGYVQFYQNCDLTKARVWFAGTSWIDLADYGFNAKDFRCDVAQWRVFGNGINMDAQPKISGIYEAGANRPPLTLLDGATLDLSAVSGTWSADGLALTDATGNNARTDVGLVSFASGAAINVNLSRRTDLGDLARSASPYVVAWSSQPNATFTLDAATAKYYVIEADETGVKLIRRGGLAIILK